MSAIGKRAGDDLRALLGRGGELSRHFSLGRWYCDGQGGYSDIEVRGMARRGLIKLSTGTHDRFVLADKAGRQS